MFVYFRLAAIGVAMRVAEEMDSKVGEGPVGYMVKGDSKVSNSARIVMCTYGVLLRRLQVEENKGNSLIRRAYNKTV